MGLIRYSCGHISGPHEPIPTQFGLWMFFIMLHRYMVSKILKSKKKKENCDVIASVLYLSEFPWTAVFAHHVALIVCWNCFHQFSTIQIRPHDEQMLEYIRQETQFLTPSDDQRGKVNPQKAQKKAPSPRNDIIFHLTPTPILIPLEKHCIDQTN